MRNGTCPKCASEEIFQKIKGTQLGNRFGAFLYVGDFLPKAVEYKTYICTECGYFENYITDKSTLAKIAQNWKRTRK